MSDYNEFLLRAMEVYGIKDPAAYIYKELKENGIECTVKKTGNNSVMIFWTMDVGGSDRDVKHEYEWEHDSVEEFDKIIDSVYEAFSKIKNTTESTIIMDEALL